MRERGREGERRGEQNIFDVREKHRHVDQLPLTCAPTGTKPTAKACALTRDQTGDLSAHGLKLNQLSHISQGNIKKLQPLI